MTPNMKQIQTNPTFITEIQKPHLHCNELTVYFSCTTVLERHIINVSLYCIFISSESWRQTLQDVRVFLFFLLPSQSQHVKNVDRVCFDATDECIFFISVTTIIRIMSNAAWIKLKGSSSFSVNHCTTSIM